MPLKIVKARNKKTKNLYIRGTYLGVSVDQSSGTDRGPIARRIRDELAGAIERGEYPPREAAASPNEPTFLSAAIGYLETGNRSKRTRGYVAKLMKHFREIPLPEIDQEAIDKAAVALRPHAGPGTRNGAIYTPTSAILHHAKVEIKIRRPKGAKGRIVTDWLIPPDAFGIIRAADTFDGELAVLLMSLLYIGPRLGAALDMLREDVRLDESGAWMRHQKGQPAADVRLHDDLCEALGRHLASHDRQRVFRYHQGGHLKYQLLRAKLLYLGLSCPVRRPIGWRQPPNRLAWVNFHTFRHTWATWMRKYGRADIKGLVATGNWRDERSANRYAHAVASDEWDRVDLLPTAADWKAGKIRGHKKS